MDEVIPELILTKRISPEQVSSYYSDRRWWFHPLVWAVVIVLAPILLLKEVADQ